MRNPVTVRAALAALVAVAAACERPPTTEQQLGYRGVGLEEVTNPRTDAALRAANAVPAAPPAATDTAPGQWQNVQVLTDVSAGEFTRTMNVISEWVVPNDWVDPKDIKRANKCAYCHNLANMASDEVYTKVVARRMLQMTRHINGAYTGHVAQTGVTCYSCHRGMAVPKNVWYFTDRYQPLRHYLDRVDFRVQSATALPTNDNRSSIKQTEYSYALMISMSNALGVNCGFCHNSRQWSDWSQSSPKRMTALRGIRMARDLNSNYLVPLQTVWPKERLGPNGDGAKLQCATCHNGVNKPLYGAPMAQDYPGLYPGGKVGTVTATEIGDYGAILSAAHGGAGDMSSTAGGAEGASMDPAPAAVPDVGAEVQQGTGAMGGQGQSGKAPTP